MKDENDGKLYAVKCFIKDQQGREESYRKIADELETVSSSYILPLRYLENELFVDSAQCDQEEFPVVVMEWVEGETLDAYLNRNLDDKYELEMLSYRFNRMAAWLLAQSFAHGDLKPDNILIRKDGSLVLVDYDGMFVPSMKGEKAREIGSPDYRNPSRTDADFDEHIDDFSISVIALSLKAIALNPELKSSTHSSDSLLLSEKDYRDPGNSNTLKDIQCLMNNPELSLLFGAFSIALANNSLSLISYDILLAKKPQIKKISLKKESIFAKLGLIAERSDNDYVIDEYGVKYSNDGRKLLGILDSFNEQEYSVKPGTEEILENAISFNKSLIKINLPYSVTTIGNYAFQGCTSLINVNISNNVKHIGYNPFRGCHHIKIEIINHPKYQLTNNLLIDSTGKLISNLNHSSSIIIPKSITTIGVSAFEWCESLKTVHIPETVAIIANNAFCGCSILQKLYIPDSVTTIGNHSFSACDSLMKVYLSSSLQSIGDNAFGWCKSLKSLYIPASVKLIGANPFRCCHNLSLNISQKSKYKMIEKLLVDEENGTLISCLSKKEQLTISDKIKNIGSAAFFGSYLLKGIILPQSITCIKQETFSYCTSLRNIYLPDYVSTIGDSAFEFCDHLKNIRIPSTITFIGDYAFQGCNSLTKISIPGRTEYSLFTFPDTCEISFKHQELQN
ncbi:MAG: leucine-rich repeat protein [Muribaculaceae bacterium]|nr:leucine-rich repeat protein [Muribaculaceae bacterium]